MWFGTWHPNCYMVYESMESHQAPCFHPPPLVILGAFTSAHFFARRKSILASWQRNALPVFPRAATAPDLRMVGLPQIQVTLIGVTVQPHERPPTCCSRLRPLVPILRRSGFNNHGNLSPIPGFAGTGVRSECAPPRLAHGGAAGALPVGIQMPRLGRTRPAGCGQTRQRQCAADPEADSRLARSDARSTLAAFHVAAGLRPVAVVDDAVRGVARHRF